MLPTDAKARKNAPMARGVLDYFPDALAAVAELSRIGNDQHNPGQPMHWARDKSTDHADCIMRHLTDRGKLDTDGLRHSTKVAWRALAMLQIELESAEKAEPEWVPWAGGAMPVYSDLRVDVKYRRPHDCLFGSGKRADAYIWKHTGSADDIIAYRVIR